MRLFQAGFCAAHPSCCVQAAVAPVPGEGAAPCAASLGAAFSGSTSSFKLAHRPYCSFLEGRGQMEPPEFSSSSFSSLPNTR